MYRDRDPDVFFGRAPKYEESEGYQSEETRAPTPGTLNSLVRDEEYWDQLREVAAFIREYGVGRTTKVLRHARELLKGEGK